MFIGSNSAFAVAEGRSLHTPGGADGGYALGLVLLHRRVYDLRESRRFNSVDVLTGQVLTEWTFKQSRGSN